jgi:AcrR family transcriptional regulator
MRARQRTRTPSAAGQDTRQRLIEVAAKHFAEHGYQGVSLRAIQRELGMNPATVHYYFGSKEALYRGVVDTYIHDIQEERIRRLEALDARLTGHERLERLLYDYLYPHLRFAAMEEGRDYAKILAHVQRGRGEIPQEIFHQTVRPVRRKYLDALQKLFPSQSRSELERALSLSVALMAVVATWPRNSKIAPDVCADQWARELSVYAAAGLTALFGAAARHRERAALRA